MDLRWFLEAVSTQIKDTQLFSWKFDESFKGKQMIVCIHTYVYIYIYMGSGRFPGPMELLLQQLVRVSKTR